MVEFDSFRSVQRGSMPGRIELPIREMCLPGCLSGPVQSGLRQRRKNGKQHFSQMAPEVGGGTVAESFVALEINKNSRNLGSHPGLIISKAKKP